MKAAIYVRVSTKPRKEQAKRREQTTENQLPVLRQFAGAMGWTVVAEYEDRESGAKADRPQFKAMFAAAARHEFDVVLVWSLDRFSREGIGKTCDHLRKLAGYRVAFRSFSEAFIDTTSDFAELVTAIFAFFASFERKRLGERVRAGMDRARAAGKQFGRPRLIVNKDKIASLRAEGRSIRWIGAELGISHATVRRMLKPLGPDGQRGGSLQISLTDSD